MTVLGSHSVGEVVDFLAAKDKDMTMLAKAYADFSPQWVSKDSAAYIAWTNEWDLLQKRFSAAKSMAQREILLAKATPVSNDLIPAEDVYMALVHAVRLHDPAESPGDLMNLWRRLQTAGATMPNYEAVQPKSKDADLQAYKAADKVTKTVDKAVDKAGKKATSPWLLLGLGLGGALVLRKALL